MSRIILSAFAVHNGGGGVLLRELLGAAAPQIGHAWLDARLAPNIAALVSPPRITLVGAGLAARIAALRAAARHATCEDRLFCFNNVPPLIRSAARTIVYVHTPFHFGSRAAPAHWSLRDRARLAAERGLFMLGRSNADEFWVQTRGMADSLSRVAMGRPVRVMPLHPFAPPAPSAAPPATQANARFFYPAQGLAFKNHVTLYRAWDLLRLDGLTPALEVTLGASVHAERLRQAKAGDANIINLGELPHAQTLDRLRAADALIFPSLAESFGIPLIEAAALGKPALAPERAYVRDVCTPAQTFDPADPRSIADAVRRFLGCPRPPVTPLTPEAFVTAILA